MLRALERLQALMPATGSATQAQCRQASVQRPRTALQIRADLQVTAIMHPVRNMPTSRANPDMRLNEPSS